MRVCDPTTFDATYDAADDKLRLRASSRLDAETYARVKAAGFGWAPKQDLFYAVWSPAREDRLVELAGDIDDEETTPEERAAQRAERFEGYKDRRAADAEQARKAVASVADGIPFGQPILVGHHSERHARRDAEKIENGMRRAVRLWETSTYWADRAAGAIRAAKYKELPAVRARRIKKLEAEKRGHERDLSVQKGRLALWSKLHEQDSIKRKDGQPTTFLDRALHVVELDRWARFELRQELREGKTTPESLQAEIVAGAQVWIRHYERWIFHIDNRLTFERAMLAADGGTVADKSKPEKGGACKCWVSRGTWLYVKKVNKISVTVLDNWGNGGKNFTRTIPFDKLTAVMSAAEVQAARDAGRIVETSDGCGFGLQTEKPKSTAKPATREEGLRPETPPDIAAMKSVLKSGVQIVTAPQLFPTPPLLAARMAKLAEIGWHARVLEPSSGTGNLIHAIVDAEPTARIHAVEVNRALCDALPSNLLAVGEALCQDFLTCTVEQLGRFDKVLMNPPFDHGADIAHIKHALHFLERDSVLVAICANGPRQQAELQPLASTWEELPDGTFADQGTGVRAVLMTVRR
jgi:protein-L-isoaspartate O-methyltransferase